MVADLEKKCEYFVADIAQTRVLARDQALD